MAIFGASIFYPRNPLCILRALGGSNAIAVFGDQQKAAAWLRRPNRVLPQKTPLDLLATESEARLVEPVLARMEHGVYS